MSTDSTSPDTIVLVHGLWMTPRSWEEWVPYYESKGYRVLTPAYPGFEVEVEALREDPSVISSLTVPETVAHLAGVVNELDRPPIVIGHSFGGVLTQLLLDRGCAAAGVVVNSAPTEGVRVNPPSQIKSLFPILKNPANRHKPVGFTHDEFRYAFTNTLDEEESRRVYDRYHIPAPGNWVWAYGLIANFKPGHQETWVNYKNPTRAPLLFITGGKDHIMPPSVQRSNARHYTSETLTEVVDFAERSHWTCGEEGWEEVADTALEWAAANAVVGRVAATV
ncbi:MAG TPA: alpha/beta hydrolase [Gaiellaceae bacterium]|nr:alpha/beta hydrolase [Gaiellaceae bacterium]